MKRHNKTYTRKEILVMKQMFDNGHTDAEIGQVLGRTDFAIKKKRHWLGFANDKPGRKKGSRAKQATRHKPLQTKMAFKEPTKGAKYTRYMKPSTEVSILWGLIKYTKA